MSEKYIDVTGKTIEIAIRNALEQLQMDRDSVSIEILEKEKRGFLGIGAQDAKVRVSYQVSVIDKTMDFVEELLGLMGLEARIEAKDMGDGHINVTLSGPDMGLVIGRRGENLDAMQYITNLSVNKGETEHVRISIDTENYRAKRETALEQLARRVAEKVVRYRKPVTLEPMAPNERRIIHSTLQDYPGVTTYSIGVDPNRRVVVKLPESPEIQEDAQPVRKPRAPREDKPATENRADNAGREQNQSRDGNPNRDPNRRRRRGNGAPRQDAKPADVQQQTEVKAEPKPEVKPEPKPEAKQEPQKAPRPQNPRPPKPETPREAVKPAETARPAEVKPVETPKPVEAPRPPKQEAPRENRRPEQKPAKTPEAPKSAETKKSEGKAPTASQVEIEIPVSTKQENWNHRGRRRRYTKSTPLVPNEPAPGEAAQTAQKAPEKKSEPQKHTNGLDLYDTPSRRSRGAVEVDPGNTIRTSDETNGNAKD